MPIRAAVDLSKGEADVALRLGDTDDGVLVGRTIAESRRLFMLATPTSNGTASPSASALAGPSRRQVIHAMPVGPKQELRVFTATFNPGDRTVTHTHGFPVTVYVVEGAFTVDLDRREPLTVKAGEALVEPAAVRMTGFNRSKTESGKSGHLLRQRARHPFPRPHPLSRRKSPLTTPPVRNQTARFESLVCTNAASLEQTLRHFDEPPWQQRDTGHFQWKGFWLQD